MANARLPTLSKRSGDELQEIALVFRGNVPLMHPFLDFGTVKAEYLEFFLVACKLEEGLVNSQSKLRLAGKCIEHVRKSGTHDT